MLRRRYEPANLRGRRQACYRNDMPLLKCIFAGICGEKYPNPQLLGMTAYSAHQDKSRINFQTSFCLPVALPCCLPYILCTIYYAYNSCCRPPAQLSGVAQHLVLTAHCSASSCVPSAEGCVPNATLITSNVKAPEPCKDMTAAALSLPAAATGTLASLTVPSGCRLSLPVLLEALLSLLFPLLSRALDSPSSAISAVVPLGGWCMTAVRLQGGKRGKGKGGRGISSCFGRALRDSHPNGKAKKKKRPRPMYA